MAFVTFELSTNEIQTVKDMPAFTVQALLNDFAGNSGMLLGISILDLLFLNRQSQRFSYILMLSGHMSLNVKYC